MPRRKGRCCSFQLDFGLNGDENTRPTFQTCFVSCSSFPLGANLQEPVMMVTFSTPTPTPSPVKLGIQGEELEDPEDSEEPEKLEGWPKLKFVPQIRVKSYYLLTKVNYKDLQLRSSSYSRHLTQALAYDQVVHHISGSSVSCNTTLYVKLHFVADQLGDALGTRGLSCRDTLACRNRATDPVVIGATGFWELASPRAARRTFAHPSSARA
ncbi:hypothetical protein F4809DRAFT_641051 [Biscogniauxia mediterranea]|nr:hypothetical protein F4809DRAFT_641051 [Biscogniauxia mediterranea]